MTKQHNDFVNREEIRNQATLLAKMLLESVEYTQYQEAKQKLQDDSEQASILSQLRQHQLNLRLAQLWGDDNEEELSRFDEFYTTFCLEPVINDFLYAEGRLGRLLSEIQQICGEQLDLWTDIELQKPIPLNNLN